MNYYAAWRPYGVHSLNTNGPRADKVLRFPTRTARDGWVDIDPDRREELRASDREVRRVAHLAAQFGPEMFHTARNY